MTHPIYSEQYLVFLTLQQLQQIAAQLGTAEPVDCLSRKAWVAVIVEKQSELIQKKPTLPQPAPEEILEQRQFSEEVCEVLALRIYDLELEYGDVVFPPGTPSWEVYDFCGVLEGCITKHPNQDTYHTTNGGGAYNDPYTAALSLVSPADLKWAKAQVAAAREERAALPDYM